MRVPLLLPVYEHALLFTCTQPYQEAYEKEKKEFVAYCEAEVCVYGARMLGCVLHF